MKMKNFCSAWPQYLMAIMCNVATLTYGLHTGWLAPLQPHLQSSNSPLGNGTEPLTGEEISWIGGLPSITLILGAPVFGYTMDRFGRKASLLLTNAPNIVAYLLLVFARGPYFVYASRIIGGFCSCGAFIVGPIYINETVQSNLKGPLGGLTGFFVKLGMILSYVLGAYTPYLVLNLISMSFTLIFLVLFYWLPESPVYLLGQRKKDEAIRALKRLRPNDDEHLYEELQNIEGLLAKTSQHESKRAILKQFIYDRPLRNAIIIVAGIYSFQMLSGYPAVVRYCVTIFDNAGVTFSSYIAAILLAASQLFFSFFGAMVLEKSGRKILLIVGLGTMGTCMGILAVYLSCVSFYRGHWVLIMLRHIPVISLLIFIAAYALAFGCVPFVIIPELFAPETRAMASTVLNLWFAVVEFFVAKLFPTLSEIIDMWGTFAIFTFLNYIGVIFICIFMFETKGLEFTEIYVKLGGEPSPIDVPQSATKPLLTDKNVKKFIPDSSKSQTPETSHSTRKPIKKNK